MLGWALGDLAAAAGLDPDVLASFEAGRSDLAEEDAGRLGLAFVKAGVIAIRARRAGEGVRFRAAGEGRGT